MKLRFALILCFLFFINFYQSFCNPNNNVKIEPKSFSYQTGLTSENNIFEYKFNKPNVDSLVEYDTTHLNSDGTFRFGISYDVDIDIFKSGTWDTIDNKFRILRYKISSKGDFTTKNKFQFPKLNHKLNNEV